MKRWIAVMAVAFVLTPMVRADEASRREKVKELIVSMHMDQMMDQMTTSIKTQMEQMVQQTPGVNAMTPAQKKVTDAFEANMMSMVMNEVGWKTLEPDFVTLYAQTFTDEEIDGMLAFYKSPVGQSMLAKMPQIMAQAMQISQSKIVDLQPKMKALQDQYVKDMAAAAAAKS